MKFSTISGLPLPCLPWTGTVVFVSTGGRQVTRALAERAHPEMILVELLAAGQRAPGISSCTLV